MVREISSNFNGNSLNRLNSSNSASKNVEPLFSFSHIEKTDAIHDYKADVEIEPNMLKEAVHISFSSPAKVPVIDSWKRAFANYKPKNQVKYNKVYKFVENLAKKQGNINADIKAICNMVCKLSDDYGMDPEIIASILGAESGGFVFEPRVMSARKNYKGVMQVNYTTIETLYAEPYNPNKKYPNKHARDVSYSHRYAVQDQKRIDELKKKYPTPQALWQAIQKDVSLGVEVGIMAYKIDLGLKKGDTRAALALYCGNQYKLPANSTAVRKYDTIPPYKKT